MKVPLSRNLEVDLLFSGTTGTYFEAARSAGRPGLDGRSGPSVDPDRPGRSASGGGGGTCGSGCTHWASGQAPARRSSGPWRWPPRKPGSPRCGRGAEDTASLHGEFTRFDGVRVYPKPVRDRRIPIVVGGNSDPALRRAAAFGDGWYAFYLRR